MEMAAAAGMAGEGLGHEGGDQSGAVGDLLHAVLEGKGLVGGREVRAGAVDCLELGAAILAIMGDDVDAIGAQPRHELVEEGRVLVAHGMEDVDAFEQTPPGLGRKQVVFVFVPHHDVVAERVGALGQFGEHPARRGALRFAVVPVAEAHDACRLFEPRHDPQRVRVRKQRLIGVVAVAVQAARRHDVGGCVEPEHAAVEIQAPAGVGLRPCRSARSWSARRRPCRPSRSADIRFRFSSARPSGSRLDRRPSSSLYTFGRSETAARVPPSRFSATVTAPE